MWLLVFLLLCFVFIGQEAQSGRKQGFTTIYQFLQRFLWGRHIWWAGPEQCGLLTTAWPTGRGTLPFGERVQKTGTWRWLQRCFPMEGSEWFRSRALKPGMFCFNRGSGYRCFLDALRSPIVYRKPTVGSKVETKGKLIQKIGVMLFLNGCFK